MTAQAGTTSIDVWRDTALSGNDGATGRATALTGTPGATMFGWTASAASSFAWAAQEVLPATGC